MSGTCVDHTIHLAVEDTLDEAPEVKAAFGKAHAVVNYLKDSCLAREAFFKIQDDLAMERLTIILGTDNRS